jgi:hypothetical protein
MIYVTGPRRRHIQKTKKGYFTNNWGSSYASIELIEGRNKKEMKREEGMERREKRTLAIC